MFKFIPREEAFFELFQQAAHNMIEGSRLLKELMEKFEHAGEQVKQIKAIEHLGDGLTHDIVRKLNKTFITPIDREDIHDLASALDDILDEVDAVADRFLVFKVRQPTDAAIKLANILYQATVAVGSGIDRLANGNMDMNDCAIQVNSLENEADRVSREAISKLFDEDKDPISVIKWKEIYETFEKGTDSCEDVSNILERIELKSI
ncbi:MAG: phosphate transport regulator [Nitrospirales bacterium]|nr:MAG: phosphate transport regulator [Nitrospirales bacterium]